MSPKKTLTNDEWIDVESGGRDAEKVVQSLLDIINAEADEKESGESK